MVDAGFFVGEPVELLGGELVELSPQGDEHAWAITRLTRQLAPLIPRGFDLGVQVPLAVDDESLPEPDLAVTDERERGGHPRTAHAVIDVAATSQQHDLLMKAPRYAGAEVPLYVVIDLAARVAIVHRDPVAGRYERSETLRAGDTLEVLGQPLDLGELLQAD